MLEKECNRDDFERNGNKMSFPKVSIGNLPRLSFSQTCRNGGCVEYLRLQALGMKTNLNNVPLMGKAPSTLRERTESVSTGVRGKLSHGFTLIELLVVVLIIGILAAVALPQYQKAVLRSRATECILGMERIQKAVELVKLEHGDLEDLTATDFRAISPIDVSDVGIKIGDSFSAALTKSYCNFYVERDSYLQILSGIVDNSKYSLEIFNGKKACYTEDTSWGEYICKSLQPLGWAYEEGSW